MLRKVLIANRGEIAVRIARACYELGVASVMVYSEADRSSLHLRSGDEAYYLGASPASESYLRADRIIEVALTAGCDAVHPGYGFLSENAEFASAVVNAGLIWIGPPPPAIALMGSKIESKRLAEAHGVPVVPGYFGSDQADETLRHEAQRIGFPLLVKASAGGGGKGMRIVSDSGGLLEALQGARREASAAFGDDALMIEKYLTAPRHIEVQVLGDLHGHLRHLGERDCTIQRRHQKIVEESPSPVIDEDLRAAITSAAVTLSTAAKYSSAGTVEFIFQDGAFYFLEMNTRIQVEHPVTEEALGVDLVQAQIRIASGEFLDSIIGEPQLTRHAFEARLYAEDPNTGFLPSVGRLNRLKLPAPNENVRVDSGVSEGDSVTPFYDPMIAKIITSGPDRAQALLQMRNALNAVEVEGPKTNLGFLKWLFANPDFMDGNFSTRFIEQHYTPGIDAETPLAVLLAASRSLVGSRLATQDHDSVWRASGWRHGRQQMPLHIVVAGNTFRVTMSKEAGHVDCWAYEVQHDGVLISEGKCVVRTLSAGGSSEIALAVDMPDINGSAICRVRDRAEEGIEVSFDGLTYPVRLAESLSTDHLNKHVLGGAEDTLASPMPGKVLKLLVQEGEEVFDDQPLVIIEAMKMEFTVRAPHSGRIARLAYPQGSQVAVGDVLIEMEKAQ